MLHHINIYAGNNTESEVDTKHVKWMMVAYYGIKGEPNRNQASIKHDEGGHAGGRSEGR